MKIFDNTKGIKAKEHFEVGDLVKSQDGNIFMVTSNDENCEYYLVSLGDGSISYSCYSIDDLFKEYDIDPSPNETISYSCYSIDDLFKEGYLDETDKKVSGFLTISDFPC